jgi:quercetin dioxygenase-like cupin family protein
MFSSHKLRSLMAVIILLITVTGAAAAQQSQSPSQSPSNASVPAGVIEVLSQKLPKMDGANLTVKLIEVTYAAGAASRAHSHPCVVVGYVVDGAIVSQVKGEAEGTYPAGKAFYEAPNGVHAVSKNASATTPSKLLAIFICDKEGPLTVPAPRNANDSH